MIERASVLSRDKVISETLLFPHPHEDRHLLESLLKLQEENRAAK